MKKTLSNLVKASMISVLIASMFCISVFAGTESVDQAPVAASAEAFLDTAASEDTMFNVSVQGFLDVKSSAYIQRKAVMRSKPSSKGKKICTIPKSKSVTLTGLNDDWCRVKYKGKTGYVSMKYFSDPKSKEELIIDISNVPAAKAQRIRSIIKWDAPYSKSVENAIISEMNKLPDTILYTYLNVYRKSIHVVSSFDQYDDTVVAHIHQRTFNKRVILADMYFKNDVKTILASVLHEVGHFVNRVYTAAGIDTSLENFKEDGNKFAKAERNNNPHYATNSKEYFAELFRYTIDHGQTKKYVDTYKIQTIIKGFNVLQRVYYSA